MKKQVDKLYKRQVKDAMLVSGKASHRQPSQCIKENCIAEIRAYWVEPKPCQIDNPRHHYQIA